MRFRFVDLFCGGGGSVTGAVDALKAAGVKYEGRCFNHWNVAIRTIMANHPELVPDFDRACAPVESVLPDEIFSSDPTRLDVLWASPSCTHHSVAAGGKPRSNQLRSQPENLLPYLRLTRCRRMFVENVPELESWGPLLDEDITWKGRRYKEGQPDPRKRGKFFDLWLREIKESGYRVDYRVLNAADYGAATSRRRLIVQAVRKSSGEKIVWPEQTHSSQETLFGYRPWRSAAEIIDWSIPGESIFDRKKPLCANTLRRIEAGIRKFWGEWAEPFLIVLRGTGADQINSSAVPLTVPLPALTAGGGHMVLIRPFWTDISHTRNMLAVNGTVDTPLNTITCSHGSHAIIMPFITRYNGGENRNHGVNSPVPVIDCGNRYGVVQPLVIPQQSDGTAKPADDPVPTIATSGAISLVQPFMTQYYGASGPVPVDVPCPTISTRDRFGLVQGRMLRLPDGQLFKLDITHRMLSMRELADATGFPHDYGFAGTDTDAKKQIGNAVPPPLAEALYRAALAA